MKYAFDHDAPRIDTVKDEIWKPGKTEASQFQVFKQKGPSFGCFGDLIKCSPNGMPKAIAREERSRIVPRGCQD